jgi:predicted transposase/invertase (TIGR01784 family)
VPDTSIHQPHDKLVKSTFSDLDNARAFLEAHLPEAVALRADWSTLQLVSGSFIDPEFAATASDLLYIVQIDRQPALLYILFEHQNREYRFMGLRLLTSMVHIWNGHLRDHPRIEKLPPILPLVLAQDNKPWKTSTRFFDLIDAPEGLADALRKHSPDFEFNLVELFRMPFDKILGTPAGILTLRALKAEKLGSLLDEAVWDESLLTEISPAAFEMLLRYIFDRDIDKPAFRRKVKDITNSKIANNAMTLAEQFRQEGREETRSLAEQFRQEGREETRSLAEQFRQEGREETRSLAEQFRQEGREETRSLAEKFRHEGRKEGLNSGLILSKQQDILEALQIRFERVPEGLREEIEAIGDVEKLARLLRAAIRCADLEAFAAEL